MLRHCSDSELVAAAQGGDKRAFNELLERHQQMVTRLALRIIPQWEIAQELAQEAMLEAYLSLKSLRHSERFQSWLYGIALNICRNHLRRQHMNVFSLEAMMGGLAFDALSFTSAEPDPQHVAETRELHTMVLAAVNTLSPKNRETVLLFYYEELSIMEIAGMLSISVAAVKARLYKSRQQLHNDLIDLCSRPEVGMSQERKDSMVKVTVIDVLRQESSDHHIIILAEENGRRLLPIWFGPFEAEAIAIRLLDRTTPRPMTFEFMANLLMATGVILEEVSVSALKGNTFYATVKLRNGDRVQEVDARPSDAIALALRLDSPIYVADDVMAAQAIDVPEQRLKTPVRKGLAKIAEAIEERTRRQEQKLQETKELTATRLEEEKRVNREKLLVALFGEDE